MTEREKIIEIIAPFVSAYGEDEAIADALIEAGYGDVKERKFEADHYWRMWQGSLVELERAEHRAEVAERALLRLCEETMRDKLIIMYPIVGRQVRDKQELYDYCIEQAEKEIEEEGKQ